MIEPVGFAAAWIAAWNARDVEAVLVHYDEDIVFTSPTAARVVPESDGVIHGKHALRSYWNRALKGNPDLAFTLIGVYAGVETVVLHYHNQQGAVVSEVVTFRGRLIVEGHATHLRRLLTSSR